MTPTPSHPRHLDTWAPRHLFLWALIAAAALLAHRAPRIAQSRPPAPVGACAGDLTGDRAVQAADLSTLLANFGRSDASHPQGDLNDDQTIDGRDLVILLTTYGCHEWEATNGFELTGPPADAIDPDLEPWMPGGFHHGDTEARR